MRERDRRDRHLPPCISIELYCILLYGVAVVGFAGQRSSVVYIIAMLSREFFEVQTRRPSLLLDTTDTVGSDESHRDVSRICVLEYGIDVGPRLTLCVSQRSAVVLAEEVVTEVVLAGGDGLGIHNSLFLMVNNVSYGVAAVPI